MEGLKKRLVSNDEDFKSYIRILAGSKFTDLYEASIEDEQSEKEVCKLTYLELIETKWGKNAKAKLLYRLHIANIPKETKVFVLINRYTELEEHEDLLNQFFEEELCVLESVTFTTHFPANCRSIGEWDESKISRGILINKWYKNLTLLKILDILHETDFDVWQCDVRDSSAHKKAVEKWERIHPNEYDWTLHNYRVIVVDETQIYSVIDDTNSSKSYADAKTQYALLLG